MVLTLTPENRTENVQVWMKYLFPASEALTVQVSNGNLFTAISKIAMGEQFGSFYLGSLKYRKSKQRSTSKPSFVTIDETRAPARIKQNAK